MKRERSASIIARAVELVQGGLIEPALGLLRPLLGEEESRDKALEIVAYCLERKGDLPHARYLYQEALRRLPDSPKLLAHVRRCEEAYNSECAQVAQRKAGWFLPLLAVLLMLVGAIGAVASFPSPAGEFIEDCLVFLNYRMEEHGSIALAGSIAAGVLSIILWVVWFLRKRRVALAKRHAVGPDFANPKKLTICHSCLFPYEKRLKGCPYCATPRDKTVVELPAEKLARAAERLARPAERIAWDVPPPVRAESAPPESAPPPLPSVGVEAEANPPPLPSASVGAETNPPPLPSASAAGKSVSPPLPSAGAGKEAKPPPVTPTETASDDTEKMRRLEPATNAAEDAETNSSSTAFGAADDETETVLSFAPDGNRGPDGLEEESSTIRIAEEETATQAASALDEDLSPGDSVEVPPPLPARE